ncbi:hypothetical protein HMPREF0043_01783 [Actinobaculum sp. oral taxon 183 str. F0552]|jgi:hypothetical protein|nr:hypothetical protein HMPREF0043_01783 [Actinobaculum sp. oral taxon 183 str. F0552]
MIGIRPITAAPACLPAADSSVSDDDGPTSAGRRACEAGVEAAAAGFSVALAADFFAFAAVAARGADFFVGLLTPPAYSLFP